MDARAFLFSAGQQGQLLGRIGFIEGEWFGRCSMEEGTNWKIEQAVTTAVNGHSEFHTRPLRTPT